MFFFEKIKTDQGWGKNLALGPFSGWPLVRNVGVNPHHKHVWFHSLIPYWGPPSFGQFLSFWATPKDIWSYVLIDTASSRHVRILNWGCYSFFLVPGILPKAIHTSDTSSEYYQLGDSMLPVDRARTENTHGWRTCSYWQALHTEGRVHIPICGTRKIIDSASTCNPNVLWIIGFLSCIIIGFAM